MPFAHVAVAVEGCSFTNPDYFPLTVAANVLGSYDRSMNVMPHRALDNKIGEYSMVNHEAWRTFAECVAREDMVSAYQSFNVSYKNTGRKKISLLDNVPNYAVGFIIQTYSFLKRWQILQ